MTESTPEVETSYLFVTGGVMSGLGKGITAASIGRLLINAGLDVTAIKVDPYLNVDAGTMNPLEHGEVYVMDDGGEVDLDLGNYERFLNEPMTSEHNITTGTVYESVINRERSGDYLGKTVQIIPHITNEITRQFREVPDDHHDVCLIELGGTVGDIEGMAFLEAVRQFRHDIPDNTVLCHVTLVPYSTNGEQKTKPTQHSIKELRGLGLEPEIVVGRCDDPLLDSTREKIALFGDVPNEAVFSNPDVDDIYHAPQTLESEGIHEYVMDLLDLHDDTIPRGEWGSEWRETVTRDVPETPVVNVAIVGKYDLEDAYMSIHESLKHTRYNTGTNVEWEYIPSETLETDDGNVDMEATHSQLSKFDAVIVPGGFGDRGTEGKIAAIRYARTSQTPFLGLCYGMQLAVVEYAREVAGLTGAHSAEINEETTHPVIDILPEQHDVEDLGGTMRLGAQTSSIEPGTIAADLYGDECVERHRHRYEVNPEYVDRLESVGPLTFSGTKNNRMEIIELDEEVHPFFFGTQFHPEYTSRPDDPNPAFMRLVETASGDARSPSAVEPVPDASD
jgi:CTP synthase